MVLQLFKSQEPPAAPVVGRLYTACNAPSARRAKAWLSARLSRMEREGRFSEEVTVTPELAELLLERNARNRNLNENQVRAFADAMRRGEWTLNGEPIIVADTGELNDGQHRLSACIESGKPFVTFICFGVSRSSRETVDLGTKRTAAHVLAMSGEVDQNNLATAIKLAHNYEKGVALKSHVTPQQAKDWLANNPAIRDSLSFGRRVYGVYRQSCGGWAALHYQMAKSDPVKAAQFFDRLATGIGITSVNDPIGKLRNRLTENASSKAKLPFDEIAAITIKAWNKFKVGRGAGTLKWASGQNEAFPKVM